MTPEQLTEDLKKLLGENLTSVVLYGSAAIGAQTKHFSDINILMVADMDLETLKKVSPVIQKWTRNGNPPPLIFSEEFMTCSQDVFAIEYLDIQAAHRVLYGKDPVGLLKISRSNLRHQLEFELRSKWLQLRQRFLQINGDPKALRELLGASLSGFTALFRATLRTLEESVPEDRQELWKALHKHVAINVESLHEILRLREGAKHSSEE